MTVVVTACDAEYLTWLTNNAQIKYELESFKDYQPANTDSPDPSCPSVLQTKGVTSKQVDQRFNFTKVAG
jgi:homogentisate 1,2-dioxygenase